MNIRGKSFRFTSHNIYLLARPGRLQGYAMTGCHSHEKSSYETNQRVEWYNYGINSATPGFIVCSRGWGDSH